MLSSAEALVHTGGRMGPVIQRRVFFSPGTAKCNLFAFCVSHASYSCMNVRGTWFMVILKPTLVAAYIHPEGRYL